MISFWTRRRAGHRAGKHELSGGNLDMELTIPTHFRCPISLDLMKDPVTLTTGITYDRESIEKWIEAGNHKCPVTNQVLRSFDQIPNHAIRKMIQDWCVENRSNGVERIPTPIIPVTQHEVLEIGSRIMVASRVGDGKKCQELVGKMKRRARESKRNKKCVVDNGTGCVLAASFESFATMSMEKHAGLLMEILSALVWVFPLGAEGQSKLSSAPSLRCMAWFLNGEDLSARQNAVIVLKELFSLDQQHVTAFAEIDGVVEALVRVIEEPICPTATKASLMAIYHMISPSAISEKMARRFVELGLISLILEILVDAERGISEKALGVLEGLCGCDEGREKARNHGLAVPVLVKKILRVSDMATEFSVSALCKLCKTEEGVIVEALQVGAFQKLLLVLQVGCGERTKEKATELLKLLNHYKDRLSCFDSSMDFKYLKRSY
ncbi:U-box domain-containing protein 21 [Cornus florida]|uniref:U-box domain-containing protein 21 n=1 Tax=Cornus florida TaxID=4283 RepID=UPI0028A2DD01|nr:U-box domain-containing protein 21 [Cornus florida]